MTEASVEETGADGETLTPGATDPEETVEETATATVETTTVDTAGTETVTRGAATGLVMSEGVAEVDATEALVVGVIGRASPRKTLPHTPSREKLLRTSPASPTFCSASVA